MADNSLVRRVQESGRRRIHAFIVDAQDYFAAKRGEFTEFNPPRRLRRLVGDEVGFSEVGEEFTKYFVDICGLKPNESILDVGCGSGRIACVLTKYLNPQGRYEGFDIVKEGIEWDNKIIAAKFPNFHFQHSNLYNKSYNPKGKSLSSEYKFPYPDESFDFVFLTSVFTHMLPRDMEHYLSEIVRVLKTDGRCLITFFLLNNEAKELAEAKTECHINFPYQFEGYRANNPRFREAAVAYEEDAIRALYERYGLRIKQPIHYGSWCGRQNYLSVQDIIVAVKNARQNKRGASLSFVHSV
jgi:ubiquinone/menaquinone biosynthesis C-methylase UbiE